MNNLSEHINNRFFRLITKASRALNYESYVIGGYVRDILLNRPSNDIDIVTVGSGIELALYSSPKNFSMVFALAGDSTITRFFCMF